MTYAQLTLFGWAMYVLAFLGAALVLWDGRKFFWRLFLRCIDTVGIKYRHKHWSMGFCWKISSCL